jgi:hypothetical protein
VLVGLRMVWEKHVKSGYLPKEHAWFYSR